MKIRHCCRGKHLRERERERGSKTVHAPVAILVDATNKQGQVLGTRVIHIFIETPIETPPPHVLAITLAA